MAEQRSQEDRKLCKHGQFNCLICASEFILDRDTKEVLWYCVVCGKPVCEVPLREDNGQRDEAIILRTLCGIGCYNECQKMTNVVHGSRCSIESKARELGKPEMIYWRKR